MILKTLSLNENVFFNLKIVFFLRKKSTYPKALHVMRKHKHSRKRHHYVSKSTIRLTDAGTSRYLLIHFLFTNITVKCELSKLIARVCRCAPGLRKGQRPPTTIAYDWLLANIVPLYILVAYLISRSISTN